MATGHKKLKGWNMEKVSEKAAKRNLKDMLQDGPKGTLSSLTCAWDTKTSNCLKCKKNGFVAQARGAYVKARICPECLAKCERCFGICKTEKDESGVRDCMTPPIRRVVDIINLASLPARYWEAAIGHWGNNTGNSELALKKIKAWIREFGAGNQQKGLILQGDVGIGKTYLLVAIAKALAKRGYGVRYVDFFSLILDIKTKYEQSDGGNRFIKELIECEVLIIDEIGKGVGTDFEMSVLDQLIDGRYNAQKIVIGATNYSMSQQDKRSLNAPLDTKRNPFGGSLRDIDVGLHERIGSRIFTRIIDSSVAIEFVKLENMRNLGFQSIDNLLNKEQWM